MADVWAHLKLRVVQVMKISAAVVVPVVPADRRDVRVELGVQEDDRVDGRHLRSPGAEEL